MRRHGLPLASARASAIGRSRPPEMLTAVIGRPPPRQCVLGLLLQPASSPATDAGHCGGARSSVDHGEHLPPLTVGWWSAAPGDRAESTFGIGQNTLRPIGRRVRRRTAAPPKGYRRPSSRLGSCRSATRCPITSRARARAEARGAADGRRSCRAGSPRALADGPNRGDPRASARTTSNRPMRGAVRDFAGRAGQVGATSMANRAATANSRGSAFPGRPHRAPRLRMPSQTSTRTVFDRSRICRAAWSGAGRARRKRTALRGRSSAGPRSVSFHSERSQRIANLAPSGPGP